MKNKAQRQTEAERYYYNYLDKISSQISDLKKQIKEFEKSSKETNWAEVGSLNHVSNLLDELINFITIRK